jgi:L-arabinokinase
MLLDHDPVPQLLRRTRAELGADFAGRAARISRAPGRLDVMGGIADYTGSLVCELPLARAAAVALNERSDRIVQVFSFNLFDAHLPFTFRIPLDALADNSAGALRAEFDGPGRRWAGYLAGCLHVLHQEGLLDLRDPKRKGVNLAVLSTVPLGAGVSSSAAIEVAAMINLMDHFAIRQLASDGPDNPAGLALAAMCQKVENTVVGAPCGIMDQVASCCGRAGTLLRMRCQPHELRAPLKIPSNVRFLGINSNVKHSVGGGAYGRTRCAAFMAHAIILDLMRRAGSMSGRALAADPMNGYLANLDPEDYRRLFRPRLPELIKGGEFLLQFGGTIDTATRVDPDEMYAVQHAADHHVLEARRVAQFAEFLEQANHAPPGTREQGILLDKAGHLMYASHLSYTADAMLGAEECDLLVNLVRSRERDGLYGAKITGGGSGGTVAVLADKTTRADSAIAQIMSDYQRQTDRQPELLVGTSPGAWELGTALIEM